MRRVVLLPGLDGTGALFAGLIRVAGECALLEPVAFPPEPLSYSALAAWLGGALELTSETVLVAESFSGPLAVHLAAAHPIAALVLCNSFVSPPRAPLFALFARAPLFRIRPPSWLVRSMLVGGSASDDLVASVRTAIRAHPASTLAARLRSVLTVDARAALARCTAPITYLRGTDDRLVSEASVAEVERASSAPVRIVRMRGPHLLLQAEPEHAWRALETVIRHVSAA